jgi:hypothetical protein
MVDAASYGLYSTPTNSPSGAGSYDTMLVQRSSTDVVTQLYVPRVAGSFMSWRGSTDTGATWTAWHQLVDANTSQTIGGAKTFSAAVNAPSYTSSIINNVGFFGTASQAQKIDVLSGGSTTGIGVYSGSFSGSFQGTGTVGPGTVDSLALFNGTTVISSSVMFQSASNIGIGFSTPIYKLEVSGSQRIRSGSLGVNVAPNATVGRIDASNDVVAFSSDERLKTNVELITSSLIKINTLHGFTFTWNDLANTVAGYDTTTRHVGVYAQEIQRILPEAVKLAPFDNDGFDNSLSGEHYLTVQYEKIVPLLIEAIKELKKEIDELRSQIV